jgi:hypothetical protein
MTPDAVLRGGVRGSGRGMSGRAAEMLAVMSSSVMPTGVHEPPCPRAPRSGQDFDYDAWWAELQVALDRDRRNATRPRDTRSARAKRSRASRPADRFDYDAWLAEQGQRAFAQARLMARRPRRTRERGGRRSGRKARPQTRRVQARRSRSRRADSDDGPGSAGDDGPEPPPPAVHESLAERLERTAARPLQPRRSELRWLAARARALDAIVERRP